MACGVGVGLNPSRGRAIVGGFQQSTAQLDDLVVGGIEPFGADNVEVEVDLLWGAVRPLGLDMARSQLDA
jgi:hypothetical protein